MDIISEETSWGNQIINPKLHPIFPRNQPGKFDDFVVSQSKYSDMTRWLFGGEVDDWGGLKWWYLWAGLFSSTPTGGEAWKNVAVADPRWGYISCLDCMWALLAQAFEEVHTKLSEIWLIPKSAPNIQAYDISIDMKRRPCCYILEHEDMNRNPAVDI